MSPTLTILPPLITGRTMQSVGVFGGMVQAVATAPGAPRSVSLQSVEPWSNTQLCPPPVKGWLGSLFSWVDRSGTNTEPAVPVKTCGDQVAAVGTGGCPITYPLAGKVE